MNKVFFRGLIGVPVGIAVSTLISLIISLCIGSGEFYAVPDRLIEDCGSELNAVIVQTLCSMLYGAIWAGASVVWEIEKWSLLKQTVIHLVICSLGTFPIAFFTYWMPHNVSGFLSYFLIFAATYAGVWLSQYGAMKKKVDRINQKINRS